ncbi:TetR/AcrR family transcriptional regulator [Streptomyces sp. NPDC059096]|uniref:TetR/AcrR family transcriptional regulator n=1 Tax=Streptomyces sp. NPDC059096 TaxID=3346727 RepID=UPI003678B8B1
MTEEGWRERRADARRNHDRVLTAAVEVFTEHGLDATIPQVAARAGVGKATVYRSYPTKAALVEALTGTRVQWLRDVVADTDARIREPQAALESAIHRIVERLAHDRLLVDMMAQAPMWHAATGPAAVSLTPPAGGSAPPFDDETAATIVGWLDAARDRGGIRDDVTTMDLLVLIGGVAHVLLELDVRDHDVWRRYATLALAALRA